MNTNHRFQIRRGLVSAMLSSSLALSASLALLPLPSMAAPAAARAAEVPAVTYQSKEVDGVRIFYREAGPADAPQVLLLHGFGASSFMFRELIPQLATKYHVIAPDLPGFGQTVVPAERQYRWTFASVANTMEAFTDAVNFNHFAVYVFDYGAPTAYRLALKRPEKIAAIISQNGNAYEEGLTSGWAPIQAYWKNPGDTTRSALRALLTLQTTRWQYEQGTTPERKNRIAPEAITLAQAAMDAPGNDSAQLDLFGDYQNNLALYPQFQAYFRSKQPPLLAVWGRNDPFFAPAGAEAYQRDNPNAEVHLYEAGHLALETNGDQIIPEIKAFLGRVFRQR